jgi:sarcosine oxidase, subunit alpha
VIASPLKRSSVHHLHAREQAKFIVQHGWELAASFGDAGAERNAVLQSVALADVSWLGKLECKGPWAASIARQRLAGAMPCPVTPERLLWIIEPSSTNMVRGALEGLRGGQSRCYLLDVTSVYASFDLVGPRITDVLCKVSAASPEPGTPIFAPVDGVRCLLVRHERGLQLHFQREFGEFLWESLLDAGQEFDIRPVGLEALAAAHVGTLS